MINDDDADDEALNKSVRCDIVTIGGGTEPLIFHNISLIIKPNYPRAE